VLTFYAFSGEKHARHIFSRYCISRSSCPESADLVTPVVHRIHGSYRRAPGKCFRIGCRYYQVR
jgi:hypothetical protein